MRLTIDTNEDSSESILAAINLLQIHVKSKNPGHISNSSSLFNETIYSEETMSDKDTFETNYNPGVDERLAKKIERARAKKEEFSKDDEISPMSMFDAPIMENTGKKQEADLNVSNSEEIRLIPY